MQRAVHATTAEQTGVGRVHQHVGRLTGEIAPNGVDGHVRQYFSPNTEVAPGSSRGHLVV